ncbi:MAG: Ig-like domain-containing protein [Thermoplasmata archaeon]|nr:Ig-like domain-containing protein [Thermoplasmata archaeon]
MAKRGKGASKKSGGKQHAKSAKSDEMLECYYCSGLVHDWNWRCPHCGKLFGSGKRAIAIFLVVILIAAIIGTYPIWRPRAQDPSHPLTVDRVTPVNGNTSAYLGAHPTVYFDENHPFDVAKIIKESCMNAFSITPSINGSLFWMGFGDYENVLTYIPSKMGDNEWLKDNWLQPNTTYYIKVTQDCRDEKGNRLSEEWNSWFLTALEWGPPPGGG